MSKRIILRPPSSDDVADIVKNINNLNVSRWLTVVPYPYLPKDARNWVKNQKEKSKKKNRKDYTFGIELKEEHSIIGGIGIHDIDRYQETGTIGYWIGEAYWRNGYGKEALGVLLDFAFEKLRLRRLEAEVFIENPSSGKLLESYGFKKEGIKRSIARSKATGLIHDGIFYGLLRDEYVSRKK